MIVSIKIQNFLSFGNETTVTLRPDTNLLAGINGSGKSNFIKAVRLLQAAVTEKNGLQSLFAQWGGIDEVMNVGENVEEMILTYELDKNVLGAYGQPWEQNIFYTIQIKKVSDKNSRFEDKYFLQFDTIKVEIKYDKMAYYSTDNDFFVDSLTKRITLNLINKTDPLLTIRTAIENIDIYDYFDTSPKSPLRKPIMDTSFENKLVSGGFNLPQILNQLSINHLEAFDKITEELQTVNPNFKEIRFNYLGSTILMTLREKHLKSTVNCNMLSDGTLRYLCLLAILCNPTPSSLIILDEPEMGLHPDMIFTLSRLIKEKSKTTQIIIATHSPLLLNHFDLENVTFFEKDDKNNSIQKIYNSDGFPENELTGGLWMKGYLGGRRW